VVECFKMDKPKAKSRPWSVKVTESKPMEGRSRNSFYHTSRWKKESRAYREANPLCVKHKAMGYLVPVKVVDHIVPLEICADPWDKLNWQSLCSSCNNSKAAEDKVLIAKHRAK
jgi:5-methylcytosine-specific restriction endonuclease McrA